MLLDWIHNLKLKNKIALLYVALITTAFFLSAVFLYSYVADEIRQNAERNSTDLLIQVGNFFDEKLKGVIRQIYALRLNPDFNDTLSHFLFNDEKYRYALALSRFSSSFAEIGSMEEFVASIFMDTPKGDFFDLSQIKNPNYNFKKSRLYQQLRFSSAGSIYWGLSGRDEIYRGGKNVVPLVFRFAIDGYNGDLFIIVNLDQQAILNYLNWVYSVKGNWILILDEHNREVVSNKASRELAQQLLFKDVRKLQLISDNLRGNIKQRFGGTNYIIHYQGLTVAPWKIVNIQSEQVLLQKLNSFVIYLALLTAASIMVTVLFAMFLSDMITNPLNRLEKTIQKVTQGDFNVNFDYQYRDEVGRLGNTFNFMVREIRGLIGKLNDYIAQLQAEQEKVRKEQQLKRRAELKALQAQINPHFLYNTLESIHWMADQIQAVNISRMILALSKLFKTGLNNGRDIILIRDEIENIRSYLVIQKMRYGEKFDYQITVPDQLLDLMTIKLILQPLIENAIYHGIKEKAGTGTIKVIGQLAENGTDIQFTIEDNGAGIQPMALALINSRLQKGTGDDRHEQEKGYGIYNVNERIKLYFGPQYGLHFESEFGQWTKVTLLIPVFGEEELKKYVQNNGH